MELVEEPLSLADDFLLSCQYGVFYLSCWLFLSAYLHAWAYVRHGTSSGYSLAETYLVAGLVPIVSSVAVGCAAIPVLWSYPSAEERLFAMVPAGRTISQLQVGYQIFCLVGGVLCGPPLNKPENFAHHILAGAASTLSLLPFAQYYCIFFGSLIELSNVPLTILDLFKRNRQSIDRYPGVYTANKALFALFFVVLRILVWPYFAIRMALDVYINRAAIPLYSQLITCAALIGLTALQLLWGRLVIRNIMLTLEGKDRYLQKKST